MPLASEIVNQVVQTQRRAPFKSEHFSVKQKALKRGRIRQMQEELSVTINFSPY